MLIKKVFNFLSNFHYNSIYNYSRNLKFNVFIDVGSHEGEFISRFLKFKSINRFYCFEPNEILFNKLNKKYKKNIKISISKKALGESKSIKKLFLSNLTFNSSMSSFNKKSKYLNRRSITLILFLWNKFLKLSHSPQVLITDTSKSLLYLTRDTDELMVDITVPTGFKQGDQ